jgi:hypothetical protein
MKITKQKKNGVTITTKWLNLTEYKESLDWHPDLMKNEKLIELLTNNFINSFIKEHGVDGIKKVKSFEYAEDKMSDDEFFKDF